MAEDTSIPQSLQKSLDGRGAAQSQAGRLGAYLQGSHDDRLVHHSIILELNLPSYRLEHLTAHKEAQKEG